MKPQSAKAKGRNHQKAVRESLINILGVHPEDVESRSMGAGGEDLILARAARELFPFSIECKNQEKISVFKSFDQAEANCPNNVEPILVFKKNRTETFAMIKFDYLLEMQKKINISKNSET